MSPQQPIGQQQKVGGGGPGSLGSTWSDPSVNISLDFLSAGLNPTKTPPTLNNIIQQQGIVILFQYTKYILIVVNQSPAANLKNILNIHCLD